MTIIDNVIYLNSSVTYVHRRISAIIFIYRKFDCEDSKLICICLPLQNSDDTLVVSNGIGGFDISLENPSFLEYYYDNIETYYKIWTFELSNKILKKYESRLSDKVFRGIGFVCRDAKVTGVSIQLNSEILDIGYMNETGGMYYCYKGRKITGFPMIIDFL